jgi:hypothetical protein
MRQREANVGQTVSHSDDSAGQLGFVIQKPLIANELAGLRHTVSFPDGFCRTLQFCRATELPATGPL